MLKGGAEDLWNLYVDMISQKEKWMSARRDQCNVCFIKNINTERILNCIKESINR